MLNESYDVLEQLYKNHLCKIKEIRFTTREVDVLSCIINNRKEKKIAEIIAVSPRTVSVYVYNIMGKIGCNAKDQIIDFLEKSDKLAVLREYYVQLLIKNQFEKSLQSLAAIKQDKGTCKLYCRKQEILLPDNLGLYQTAQKHLQQVGIDLQETSSDDLEELQLLKLQIMEVDYYDNLFKQALKALDTPKTHEIINEFIEFKRNIRGATPQLAVTNNTVVNKVLPLKKSYVTNSVTTKVVLALVSSIIVVGGALYYSLYYQNTYYQTVSPVLISKSPLALADFELFLQELQIEQFSANNADTNQFQKNNDLIKKIEKLLEYKEIPEIQKYLRSDVSSLFLTTYLYNLQALATYYMNNLHNGVKAQELLLYSKQLIESYVQARSTVQNSFDILSHPEILTELHIIAHLPQIYTRIIYSLGRSYIYLDMEHLAARKYFDLAKYLGEQLGLFEGYLATISGILILDTNAIAEYIMEGKVDLAKKTLHYIIDSYTTKLADSSAYVIDYNPNIEAQKTIEPQKEMYNVCECSSRVVKSYALLITLSGDAVEIDKYLAAINEALTGNTGKSIGLLETLKNMRHKKTAVIYNILGNLVTTLWKSKNIHKLDIRNSSAIVQGTIARALKVAYNDDLDLAEKLFTAAKDISRGGDYTKADAYLGLAKICNLRLSQADTQLSITDKEALKQQAAVYTKEAQTINTQLKRSASDIIN